MKWVVYNWDDLAIASFLFKHDAELFLGMVTVKYDLKPNYYTLKQESDS